MIHTIEDNFRKCYEQQTNARPPGVRSSTTACLPAWSTQVNSNFSQQQAELLLTPLVSLWRLSFRDDAARTMAGRLPTPCPGDADVPPPPWRRGLSDLRPPVRPCRLGVPDWRVRAGWSRRGSRYPFGVHR